MKTTCFDIGDDVVILHKQVEYNVVLIGATTTEPGYRDHLVEVGADYDGLDRILVTDTYVRAFETSDRFRGRWAIQVFEKQLIRLKQALPGGGYHCLKCNDPNPYATPNFGNKWLCRNCKV